MRICFLGSSHAAVHLRTAAEKKGFTSSSPDRAEIIFVSEDTPTEDGIRDLKPIIELIEFAKGYGRPVILTSQVPPGFSRAHGVDYHQAETLRMKDAEYRADNPDYIVVGGPTSSGVDPPYLRYLKAFNCPVFFVTFEEAEFSKIAVNMTLAAQVDNTNRLVSAAHKCGAKWSRVASVISHDKRIGPHSYLTPGRWQDSKHLMRDYVTLLEIERG